MGAVGNTLFRLTEPTVDVASHEGIVHAADGICFVRMDLSLDMSIQARVLQLPERLSRPRRRA